jgi:putative ABC transport system substrate-binding protein
MAAQKESTTIPIIMGTIGDPVGLGLIKSLARPGGNVTGPATLTSDLVSKRFEMLHTMVPKLSRLAILVNPSNTTSAKDFEQVQSEAQKRGLKVIRVEARTSQEIDSAFSTMVREKAGALLVLLNPLFQQQRSLMALKHRLPVSAGDPIYVEAGCLMSYGPSLADGFRRAAIYVDKIFKGAKPADLPVEQPTKFELVINRNTAKALGLTIPQSLLISADKVIE